MKYFTFIFLIIVFSTQLNGQENKYLLQVNGLSKKLNTELYNYFNSSLDLDADLSNPPAILHINCQMAKLRTIEGMERKLVGKSTVLIKFINEIDNAQHSISKSYTIDIVNAEDHASELSGKIRADKTLLNDIKENLGTFWKMTVSNCLSYDSLLNDLTSKKESLRAYLISIRLIDSGICKSALAQKIKTQYLKESCIENLKEVEILLASKTKEHLDQAVRILRRIPTNANCREETLKQIRQLNEITDKQNSKILHEYHQYILNSDHKMWQKSLWEEYKNQ